MRMYLNAQYEQCPFGLAMKTNIILHPIPRS
jgi:hypothetical protein